MFFLIFFRNYVVIFFLFKDNALPGKFGGFSYIKRAAWKNQATQNRNWGVYDTLKHVS